MFVLHVRAYAYVILSLGRWEGAPACCLRGDVFGPPTAQKKEEYGVLRIWKMHGADYKYSEC